LSGGFCLHFAGMFKIPFDLNMWFAKIVSSKIAIVATRAI